jgi:CheY-like chemotaxis protein
MRLRVLIADPSPAAVRAVQAAFPEPGFEVRAVADGGKAARALEERFPDILLAALSLPPRDGYELGAFFRSRPETRGAALIFLRGPVETLDLGRLTAIDHDGIVSKPFDAQTLTALVRRTIERRREIPSLPEEPVLAEAPVVPETVRVEAERGLDGTPLEDVLRGLVHEEFRQADWEERMRRIASAEFKKLLVEELRGSDVEK